MGRPANKRTSRQNPTHAERREVQTDNSRRKSQQARMRSAAPSSKIEMKPIVPLTEKQALSIKSIEKKIVTILTGPPGVGKTACPIGVAIKMLLSGQIDTIVVSRTEFSIDGQWFPVPGDEKEKYEYLFRNLRENFLRFIGQGHLDYLEKVGKIRFEPLLNILGRTFDRPFILLDEAQVSTVDQVKALLTRMGTGFTRVVLSGDPYDQRYRRGVNGLEDFMWRMGHHDQVGRVDFDVEDIVRHDFVKDVVMAYRENVYPEKTPSSADEEASVETEDQE